MEALIEEFEAQVRHKDETTEAAKRLNGELTGRVVVIPPSRPGWSDAQHEVPCLIANCRHSSELRAPCCCAGPRLSSAGVPRLSPTMRATHWS